MPEYKCPHCGQPLTVTQGKGAMSERCSAECKPCWLRFHTLGFGNTVENAVKSLTDAYEYWKQFALPTQEEIYERWKKENNIT